MDAATFSVLESAARRIFQEGVPIDADQCHADGIDFDALSSLVNQLSVRALKAARTQEPLLLHAIASRLGNGNNDAIKLDTENDAPRNTIAPDCTCVAIAHKFRVNGYKMVRLVLEAKYGRGILSIQHLLTEKPTLLDDDKILQGELFQCMSLDRYNAHPCEQLKECVGREYEEYLIERLTQQKMCFETEAELRSRGKPKTPDILFLIPMAVQRNSMHKKPFLDSSGSGSATAGGAGMQANSGAWEDAVDDAYTSRLSSGAAASAVSPTHSHVHATANSTNTNTHHKEHHLTLNTDLSFDLGVTLSSVNDVSVVNWIDSKALFADQETFAEHFEQLRGYVNRYGRGLVIYWHGYNAAIQDRYVCSRVCLEYVVCI
jgi:hypothetical protein